MEEKIYTASRISEGNHLFPASIIISDHELTLKIPGFFSGKSRNIVYQQIEGVNIDTPMIGYSTITFVVGGEEVIAHGFTKAEAEEIKETCSEKITATAPRAQTENISDAIAAAMANLKPGTYSIADELKKLKELVEAGVLTQAEFEEQKTRLLKG